MRKKELKQDLDAEKEKSARYWKYWTDAIARVSREESESYELREALKVALNLSPYYASKFCPKCATAIEDRQYVKADQYLPEHLVWTCKCGYVMYTRTSEDMK